MYIAVLNEVEPPAIVSVEFAYTSQNASFIQACRSVASELKSTRPLVPTRGMSNTASPAFLFLTPRVPRVTSMVPLEKTETSGQPAAVLSPMFSVTPLVRVPSVPVKSSRTAVLVIARPVVKNAPPPPLNFTESLPF